MIQRERAQHVRERTTAAAPAGRQDFLIPTAGNQLLRSRAGEALKRGASRKSPSILCITDGKFSNDLLGRGSPFVGPSPALLAIDLYELVYEGGARPIAEILKTYPSSCGEHAGAAIEPTKRLFAAGRWARRVRSLARVSGGGFRRYLG